MEEARAPAPAAFARLLLRMICNTIPAMRRTFLNLPSKLRATPPPGLADPDRAKACAACARHDESALLIAGLKHAYGGQTAALHDVSLCLHPGEIVSLVGPSGCGKTTTLRLVAGLERVQAGTIMIGHKVAGAPGRHMPAEDRNVGMMFQDYALFPHLTVLENVAFGLSRLAAAERRARARAALAEVGLAGYADRNPATLSGGQQQRVALARALAPRPKVVLLDEPFSGLDAELRRKVRGDAIHLIKNAGAAALMVTHDPEEALFMSERIAVMRGGRIEQAGDPKLLYDRPASPYVARFFSEINELSGRVRNGVAETILGPVAANGLAEGDAALVMTRPEHLLIGRAAEATGRAVEARVGFARWLGRTALIGARLPDGSDLLVRTAEPSWPEEGAPVLVALDPERAHCFGEDGGDTPRPAPLGAAPETLAFSVGLR